MASNDFIENAISSNVDESAVSDLANSLENSISNPGGGPAQAGPGGRAHVFLFGLKKMIFQIVICCEKEIRNCFRWSHPQQFHLKRCLVYSRSTDGSEECLSIDFLMFYL